MPKCPAPNCPAPKRRCRNVPDPHLCAFAMIEIIIPNEQGFIAYRVHPHNGKCTNPNAGIVDTHARMKMFLCKEAIQYNILQYNLLNEQ